MHKMVYTIKDLKIIRGEIVGDNFKNYAVVFGDRKYWKRKGDDNLFFNKSDARVSLIALIENEIEETITSKQQAKLALPKLREQLKLERKRAKKDESRS